MTPASDLSCYKKAGKSEMTYQPYFISAICAESLFRGHNLHAERFVLQRKCQNFLDSFHRMDIQIGDNVIRNFFKVAFVLIRNQNSLNAAAMRRQQFSFRPPIGST